MPPIPIPASDPFPHLVADGLYPGELLDEVLGEMAPAADPRWRRFDNTSERKLEGGEQMWGPATRALLRLMEQAAPELAHAFGIPSLAMETIGGGWHLIPPGGYLAVHADFNRSPATGRYRRLNHLTYLNHGWAEEDGGQLELWDSAGPRVTVAPEFGRTVVFQTSSTSWHGHPRPTTRWRASVAAYFYTDAQPADWPGREHSTLWHPGAARASA